jgi:hypothetical protein
MQLLARLPRVRVFAALHPAATRLVQKYIYLRSRGVRPGGCVLSDIVKRRSLQARPGENPGRCTISPHARVSAPS